jgi:hypothetical protein
LVVDPNLLLNTVALSTAALVAIVGALLISRVIALSSDREALRRREAEFAAQAQSLGEALERRRREILRRDAVDFVHEAADDIVESHGTMELDVLMERYDPRDRSADELAPFVQEASAAVAAAFADRDPSRLLHTSSDRYAILRARVQKALGEEPADEAALPAGAAPFTLKQEEAYRNLLRDAQSLTNERRSVELLRGQTQAALQGLANPSGVRSGAAVLFFFAIVGDVVPLLIMSTGPRRLTAGITVPVITLFLVGLGAFAAYLFVEIRRLTH